jgi:hypothetical protein
LQNEIFPHLKTNLSTFKELCEDCLNGISPGVPVTRIFGFAIAFNL